MNNYKVIVENVFANIIKSYSLCLVQMDDSEVFLVGKEFAFSICVSREGADIYYIMPKGKDGLVKYRLSNTLQDKFTDEDRSNYGNPSTIDERITGELKIFASGLFNHWEEELLTGDKTWFNKYQGRGIKVNTFVTNVLVPIFEEQKI